MTDLELSTNGERIIWRGKPRFNCFLLETIFNPMLFFALIWGAFDFTFIGFAISSQGFVEDSTGATVLAIFFLFHLMPVWIYLGGIFACIARYKNTEYIITERGVYISGGFISLNIQMKPFTDLSHVNIHKGFFDQLLGVGDVVMICGHGTPSYSNSSHQHAEQKFNICDIADYQNVFKIIKDMQTDIYADTMYPNAMRPDTNPGYNTSYNKY